MVSGEHRTKANGAYRRFRIVLIKPSHYDDDGYVIRWFRSPMPANSLATVYGLLDDCTQRKILGPDIDIEITRSTRRIPVGASTASSPTCAPTAISALSAQNCASTASFPCDPGRQGADFADA